MPFLSYSPSTYRYVQQKDDKYADYAHYPIFLGGLKIDIQPNICLHEWWFRENNQGQSLSSSILVKGIFTLIGLTPDDNRGLF